MSVPPDDATDAASSAESRPPVIGLVGGIGAGKSAVGMRLASLGCVVSDSDGLARAAFHDPAVIEELRGRWGDRILRDGAVDRSAVAGVVFADEGERRWLESIVHPWIEAHRRAAFEAAPPGTRALVIDAPLLLEAGLDALCDAVIFVDAPRDVRLSRVRRSRGWDEAELDRREAAQLPLDRKRRSADIVIDNAGDTSQLQSAVTAALETIEGRSSQH